MPKLIKFELKKIFRKPLTLIALIAVLLLSVLFTFSTYHNMYAFDGNSREGTGRTAIKIDKSMGAKYGGILTDEKVQQIMKDFSPTVDLHGMNAQYLYENSIQSAAFERFSDAAGHWNGLSVSDVFGNKEIKIGYIKGWLETSQNLTKILLVLSLVIVIMIAPVFAGEYGGVDSIILTSKYGKTKSITAKVAASVAASLIVTVFIVSMYLLTAFILYGSDGLDCSILFTPSDFVDAYIPFHITCFELLKYQILLGFTSAVGVTGITLILSAVSKNQTIALVTSAAIYILPIMLPITETNPLFRLIVLWPIYYSQFISIMSVEQMGSGMLYAVWAVPASLIFIGFGSVISRRIFANHQIV